MTHTTLSALSNDRSIFGVLSATRCKKCQHFLDSNRGVRDFVHTSTPHPQRKAVWVPPDGLYRY